MKTKNKTIVILGAGITGLVTAYYLSKDFNILLLEKENKVGGMSTSFKYKGFILDYGPHKIYTQIPKIIEEIKKICPLLKIKKKNSIYLKRDLYNFPLNIKQIVTKMPFIGLKACLDIFSKTFNKLSDDSYENFLINRFGKTLYNLSFRDYSEKVWQSDPSKLDRELAKRRVAISNIFELIRSILFKDTKKISADFFYYPPKGMKQLIGSLIEKIKKNKGKILTNSKISKIKIKGDEIKYIKLRNKKIKTDYLISTIPLDDFVKLIKADKEIIKDSSLLKYQKLNIIYFILNKPQALNDCWIFFPEKKFIFQRISEQKSFSSSTCPKDRTAIMVETTEEVNKEKIKEIIKQLEEIKILRENEIGGYFVKTIEKAYPVYKKGFFDCLNPILDFFDSLENFYLLGRQGLFNYNNMDQCWDMALKTVEHIKKGGGRDKWEKTRKQFDKYKIVD